MRIEANGIHQGYEEWGSGMPLVLLHAFPCNRSMWMPQIHALTQTNRLRVITPDFRGFGESDVPKGPYLMETLADDIAALLDVLKINTCALCGISMGGYVAFAFYRKYGGRLNALILANTRPQADTEETRAFREELAQLAEREGSKPVIEERLTSLLSPPTLHDPIGTTARLRAMLEATSPVGIAGALRGMALRADSTDLLPQITSPTLIINGEGDTIISPTDVQPMAERIPNAQVFTIPRAAHLSNMEQPDRFNQHLVTFLEEQVLKQPV